MVLQSGFYKTSKEFPPITSLCIKNADMKFKEKKAVKLAVKAIESVTQAVQNQRKIDESILCRIGDELMALGDLEPYERIGLYYIMTAAKAKFKEAADYFTRVPTPPICFSESKLYEITLHFYLSCGKKYLEEASRNKGPAYKLIQELDILNQKIIQLGAKIDSQSAQARYELGKLLIDVKNLPQLRDIARHHYRQAGSGGNIKALLWLAEDCIDQKDFKGAIHYFTKAALKKDLEASWKVALLSNNIGYLIFAKSLGSKEACYLLGEDEGETSVRMNVKNFLRQCGLEDFSSPVKRQRL